MSERGAPATRSFLWNVVLLAGGLMATLCGLCTAAMGAWSVPILLGTGPDAGYGWLFLVPSLVFGGGATWVGGLLFHGQRRRLQVRRPDIMDRLASVATLAGGALFALAWAAVTVGSMGLAVRQVREPESLGGVGAWFWIAVWIGVGALGTALGVWAGWGGLRRLRAALAPGAGVTDDPL